MRLFPHRYFFIVLVLAIASVNVGSATSITAPRALPRPVLGAQLARPVAVDTRLGISVDDVGQSGSVMFTDAMKQASPWSSDRKLAVDGDGNVTQLATGQQAQTTVFAFAAYPAGDYTLLYDGRGAIAIDPRSGSMTRIANGRAIVHVATRPGFGIHLALTATDPRDYIRNVRLILPGFQTLYTSTPFVPAFLARLSSLNVLRFEHWSHGDTSATALTWPMRPSVTQFTQAGPNGVAWEYQIALANAVGADPWFVVPAGATNFYITQLAALVRARLDPRLHPMFEYAQGAWQPGSPVNVYAAMAGRNFQLATDPQLAAVRWYAQRSSQLFALIADVYGAEADRVVRVVSGPPALPGSAAESVDRTIVATLAAGRQADDFAIDATGISPAAIAFTRTLLAGTRLQLIASGGAVPVRNERDVATSTRMDLERWRDGGGGLFTASSINGYLRAAGFFMHVPVALQAQLETLRAGALNAYARTYPAAHVAARPLVAQSVLAPLVFPNTYVARNRSKIAAASTSAAATDVLAIDSGGPATGAFVADQYFLNKHTWTYVTGHVVATDGVTNPAPQAVYQSQRTGTLLYTLPNLTPGATYTVRLHFAELYFAAAGQRVFNMSINGTSVLTNFDVLKTAGGQYRAVEDDFTATASAAGQIVIASAAVVNNPTINGIEVLSSAVGPTPPPPPPTPPPGPIADVTTFHNDTLRTGWNPSETVLNTTSVASSKFGLRQILNVDGLVMAQPLYVANYPVNGTHHNVLIVATEHNSVYAFDADTGSPLWQHWFGTPQTSGDVGCQDIEPEYGITSTPVIDRTSGTLYAVFAAKSASNVMTTNIGALDVGTGNTKIPAVRIAASARQSNGSTVSFSDKFNMQRASLLLANNSIYLGVGSHCDYGLNAISGWLLRYSTANLTQLAAFNTVEDGVPGGHIEMASIWGAGFGPAADAAGNIYAVTGNGAFDASSGGHNYAMSVLKFAPDLSGGPRDWFAYKNEAGDSDLDLDFGSGSAMLLPPQAGSVPNILVQMGKAANIYLLNEASLGGFSATDAGALQVLNPGQSSTNQGVWGGPAYYNGPNGPTVFYQASESVMRAFSLATGNGVAPRLSLTSRGTVNLYDFGGTMPIVSSNGRAPGTGVLWTIDSPYSKTATVATTRIEAYDATNLGRHLFGAAAGSWSHKSTNTFISPLVANGKVYAGAYKTVYVFGLAP